MRHQLLKRVVGLFSMSINSWLLLKLMLSLKQIYAQIILARYNFKVSSLKNCYHIGLWVLDFKIILKNHF